MSFDSVNDSEIRSDISDLTNGFEKKHNKILNLYKKLERGYPKKDLIPLMDEIFHENNSDEILDLFVLTFQTRDCRGGRGERILFYTMFSKLFTVYPSIVLKLIPLVPEFGYVKDLISLIEFNLNLQPDLFNLLVDSIISFLVGQLIDDYERFIKNHELYKISFTAKWIPKEGRHFHINNRDIFMKLVNSVRKEAKRFNIKGHPMKVYRMIVTTLNEHLDTSEIKMCSNRYSEIDFVEIPSILLNKWRKAFLNERIKKEIEEEEMEIGNRYPNREDRVKAREYLRHTVRKCNILPYTIINKFIPSSDKVDNELSPSKVKLLEDQWKFLVYNTETVSSRPIIPMINISNSMFSSNSIGIRPIALSILFSQVGHHVFRDNVLINSSNPVWCSLQSLTLEDKIKRLLETKNNVKSTNIYFALELIFNEAIKYELSSDDIPDICVLTDEKFSGITDTESYVYDSNQVKYEESLLKAMKVKFQDAGLKMPRIIFWNLTPTNDTYELKDDITFISGFSQNLLDSLVYETTPILDLWDNLKNILHSERYQIIRDEITSFLTSTYNSTVKEN